VTDDACNAHRLVSSTPDDNEIGLTSAQAAL